MFNGINSSENPSDKGSLGNTLLKCDCIKGSILNKLSKPDLLDKLLGSEVSCEHETIHQKMQINDF